MQSKRFTREISKVPPQNKEIEIGILSACLNFQEGLTYCYENIKSDYFYFPQHVDIFKSIVKLKKNNKPVDILSIHQDLKDKYTASEIAEISQYSYEDIDRVIYYCDVLIDCYVKREMINNFHIKISELYDINTDNNNIISEINATNSNLSNLIVTGKEKSMIDIISLSIKKLEEACKMRAEGKVIGVATPYKEFNDCTAGFQNSDLYILAARPSMGKTALALSITNFMAFQMNKKVDFYSLEMSGEQLIDRIISMQSSVSLNKIRTGHVYEEDWKNIHSNLSRINDNLFIDDTPALNINIFASRARKRKKERETDIIIVDYLQLMKGDSTYKGNREAEISDISRTLKAMAKELNIPIIALAQLSRAVESRGGNKKPMLSDLRESGCIVGDSLIYTNNGLEEITNLNNSVNFDLYAYKENNKLTKAKKCWESGVKNVLSLTLTTGHNIKATNNHKFLTKNGWKRLDKITKKDCVAIPLNFEGTKESYSIDKSYLMGAIIAKEKADKRAYNKCVPKSMFSQTPIIIQNFLAGLFDNDGSIHFIKGSKRNINSINYSSSSIELINGIQFLLQMIGIISRIKKVTNKKGNVWFQLSITSKCNLLTFIEKIPLKSNRKIFEINVIKDYLFTMKAGWNKNHFNENNTLAYIEVKNIKPVELKYKVFDIEVPEINNFFANGILVHNSLEQDADMVMFLYRADYYGFETDEAGNSLKGLGQIIIAKHRNGPLKTIKIRFKEQNACFVDYDQENEKEIF
jgi:replicative DNA helicase